jgi:hypothetical protein
MTEKPRQDIRISKKQLKGKTEILDEQWDLLNEHFDLWAEHHEIGIHQAGFRMLCAYLKIIEDPGSPDYD